MSSEESSREFMVRIAEIWWVWKGAQ